MPYQFIVPCEKLDWVILPSGIMRTGLVQSVLSARLTGVQTDATMMSGKMRRDSMGNALDKSVTKGHHNSNFVRWITSCNVFRLPRVKIPRTGGEAPTTTSGRS